MGASEAIKRRMITISNNSVMTNKAAIVLSQLSPEDQIQIKQWLELAEREMNVKLRNAERKGERKFPRF